MIVTAAFLRNAVEDNAQNLGIHKLKLADCRIQSKTVTVVLTDNNQHTIGQLGSSHGITDLTNRGQVENDVVIAFLQPHQHTLHSGGAQQFHGVRGRTAGRNNMERLGIVLYATILQQILCIDLTGQVVRQTGLLIDRQLISQRGTAHITVDQQNALAQLRSSVRQVDRRQTLAFASQSTGNTDNVALAFICKGELQLGTQQLVAFCRQEADVGTDQFCLLSLGIRLIVGRFFCRIRNKQNPWNGLPCPEQ